MASKIVATYTGPAGVAVIGQFYNFITIVLNFSNGAINTGIVKFTAEYEEDDYKLRSLFSTSLRISVYCSIFFGVVLAVFSNFVSYQIFNSYQYRGIIILLGCTLLFYSLNSILISILNGKRQINSYTIVNCVGSLAALLFTIILVHKYKIVGALYALVISQSLVFFVTIFFVLRAPWFKLKYFTQAINPSIVKDLSKYSLMAIFAAIGLPLAQILLRNYIIMHLGIISAGYWQGMMRISDGYLMIVTISLSTYFIPKLSSLKTNKELRKEMLDGFKLILPLVFLSIVVIYFLRIFIIKLLFTSNFLEMENLFLFQLIGDFFKIASYMLITLMVSKGMTKAYLITEVFFNVIYVLSGFFFISHLGLEGISVAFALNYFICFICLIIFFRKMLFIN